MHQQSIASKSQTYFYILLCVVLSTCLLLKPSYALDKQKNSATDQTRFTLLETKNGILRLDKKTGTISSCTHKNEQWTCTPIKNSSESPLREDQEDTIATLRMENLKLKQKLQELQQEENYKPDDQNPTKPKKKLQLPSEEEVDEAITYMEKMIRKFGNAMKRLREEQTTPPQEL